MDAEDDPVEDAGNLAVAAVKEAAIDLVRDRQVLVYAPIALIACLIRLGSVVWIFPVPNAELK